MSVAFNVAVLRVEMIRRGWTRADLARAAGVSQPTLSTVFRGRPVSETTWLAIELAIRSAPVVTELDPVPA